MHKHVLAILATVAISTLAISDLAYALKLTEFMAVNDSTLLDEDGEFSDWAEIHNETGAPVDLANWYLTDNAGSLTKWQFPSTVIPAGGYVVVFVSDKNRATSGQELHTSFKLSSSGEYFALVQPDGLTVEHEYSPAYPVQSPDVSYGVASDLSTERCFLIPTPGAANDESSGCGPIEPVTFSHERGFYDVPINVTLSTPTAGATIRYTTDGTTPTDTVGTIYAGAIPVTTTTAVRAFAYGPGLSSPPVLTHTYLYLDDVILQNEANLIPEYPDKWTGGTHADYDMDPEVVNDPAYSGEIIESLKSIPTLSIVTDKENLFDPVIGIYMHVQAHGVEWERPISMEIMYADGRQGIQENAGFRIQGEFSRSSGNKKHSFRMSFKNIYGANLLDWPIFPTSEIDTVDQVILTGGHGNSWHNGWSSAQYIRDTFAKDTQLDMGQLAPHSSYLHLYLNGIYWGVYRATERPNGGFLSEHLGGDKDDYDALNAGKAIDGNRDAWEVAQALANTGMETQVGYDAMKEYIDMSSMIDFFIVNQYGNNTDWDFKNWYAGRLRTPGAGFLFFSWDAEQTMASPFGSRVGMNSNDSPSSIYSDLRDNAEFRLLYGDHVHRHFFNDGALTPGPVIDRWNRRRDEIFSSLVAESARWGDKGRTEPFTRDVEWVVEYNRLVLTYFTKRHIVAVQQYRKADLYPDVDAPVFNQHGGDIDAGFALEMSAPAGTIYYTLDGTDPREEGGAVAALASTYSLPVPLGGTTTVKARALVGAEWSALNEARFMLESPIRITEIHYNVPGEDPYEFIEIANTGTSAVDVTGYTFTQGIDFTFPALILSPGDHVVVTRDQAAFTTQYGGGITIAGEFPLNKLSNSGERIVLADTAGNEIHDFTFNDQWYWQTDSEGPSLVVRDESQPRSAWRGKEGWRASTFNGGSPGSAELPLCGDGVDNDGDGDIDLADAGCANASQNFEDPECDNGLDEDKDGLVDTADPDCSAADDNEESPVATNGFVCFKIRENKTLPRFDSVDVTLDDEFEGAGPFTVRKPKALCYPADLGNLATIDPDVFLQSYDIRVADGGPEPIEREDLLTETMVGKLYLDTKKPDRIMVPAAADDTAPTTAPVNGSHDVDHYKCYRSKAARGWPKWLPSGAWLQGSNALETKNYRIKTPKRYCVPVGMDGSVIKNPDGYLTCYSAKSGKYDDKHVKRIGIHSADSFGNRFLDTSKEEEVCVPSHLLEGP